MHETNQSLAFQYAIDYNDSDLLVDTSFDSQDLAKRQVFAFQLELYTF